MDKQVLTQFGRAMSHLGIKMIPSYSPEARGRSERFFGTLQGRLTQELALVGITDMAEANEFLRNDFWPRFVGIAYLLWLLGVSLQSQEGFDRAAAILAEPLHKLILLAVLLDAPQRKCDHDCVEEHGGATHWTAI